MELLSPEGRRREGAGDLTSLRATLEPVQRPIAEATGLPNEAYTSPAFATLERDRVLAQTWTCIGVGAQVPEPGDVRPISLLGLPLILLRDKAGALRVFHNVCSHRGMELISAPCRSNGVIRCPYHSWAYALDGSLKATPLIGGPGTKHCDGFDKSRHGLKPVRSAVWCDAVFVDLSGEAPAFEAFVAPLAERWQHLDPDLLRHGGADSSFSLELACNWKLAVENFCEGYHLPWVHPSLNRYSRLEDHYNVELDGHLSGQGSHAYRPRLSDDGQAFPCLPDLPVDWREGKAEYLALYPNALFGLHADHFFTVVVLPLAEDRTRELFEIYYIGEEPRGASYAALRKANAAQWQLVFEEDRGVVEGMQRGRASTAFRGGAFSPAMDGPTHCFHKWMAGALMGSDQGEARLSAV